MNSPPERGKGGESCEFRENLSLLREIDFFSELPLEILKVLAYLCTREKFREGDFLVHKGEDDGQAFYILSGRVGLFFEEKDPDSIRELGVEKFLGGLSLIGKMPRLFYVKALEDVVCLCLEREKFSKAVAQFPELTPRLFQSVINRISKWEERMFLEHGRDSSTCVNIAGVSLV